MGLIGFAVFLFFRFELDNTRIFLINVSSVLGTFPLLITLHYFRKSRGIEIDIQPDNGLIEIVQNGEKKSFKIGDVNSLEIYQHKGLGLYEFDFDFAKYIFKNGKFCVVTSFMTNEYYIPPGIKPKIKRRFIPIIGKRTNVFIGANHI
jgi:hypothetical protein